jgi:hypothetical protein
MLEICTVRFVDDWPRHFAHRFRARFGAAWHEARRPYFFHCRNRLALPFSPQTETRRMAGQFLAPAAAAGLAHAIAPIGRHMTARESRTNQRAP